MPTTAVVFLFDANAEGVPSWYGGEFDPAFLRSLGAVDPAGNTSSTICRGDAIVANLATKITAVEGAGRRTGHTQSYDMELYKTIIWDMADALAAQWHTVDLNTFPLILANRNVYCISVPTLPVEFREAVDHDLHGTRGYLGAINIDLGNPIQKTIFIEYLVKDAMISGGQVVMELSWEGYSESTFEGAATFKPNGERRVLYGELHALLPPIPEMSRHSPRGELSAERYEGKKRFTLQERVMAALAYAQAQTRSESSFTIAAKAASQDPIEAELPEAKFVRYLLDEHHPKGGSKARFFADVLGIGPNDWRYLAAQFHDGLLKAELVEIGVKHYEGGFGVSFNAVIPVKGLNGRLIPVDTNWIMEPGQTPRLSTAVPAKRSQDSYEGVAPPVISTEIQGNERWEAIYALAIRAGQEAAAAATPTPMSVQGSPEIIMEGLCGFAWVHIPDARRGFARWLVRRDRNHRHYRGGAAVYAENSTQSIDRAVAYAKAFATVLRHNGIECDVGSRLD